MLIDLYNNGGFVAIVTIARQDVLPDAIIWGQRVFLKSASTGHFAPPRYNEGSCVVADIA